MRQVSLAAMIVALMCAASALAASRRDVAINTYGRPIQRDGFLLEWRLQKSGLMDERHNVRWDATNTAEGLAGFVRCPVLCASYWTFQFFPWPGSGKRHIEMNLDTSAVHGSFFATSLEAKIPGGTDTAVAEWLLPWDSLATDSSGRYQVGIYAFSSQGDTLLPLILSGKRPAAQQSSGVTQTLANPGVLKRIVFIGVLLILYIGLRMVIKPGRKRKETRFDPKIEE
jgi:hypothetical protein